MRLWLKRFKMKFAFCNKLVPCKAGVSNTRAACGPRGRFVRPAMLLGIFKCSTFTLPSALIRCREINEPKLNNTQCGFHPAHSTTDQNFTLQQIFEKFWEYAKNFYTCFVDLEKAYHRVPHEKLWGVLRASVDDRLLLAVKPLYSCSDVCARVGKVKSRPFTIGVGLRQGCVLLLLFSS